jgi:hypothetical protein
MFRRGVGVSKPTHEALLGRRGNVENSIYRPREERTLQKRPTREPSSMADFPMSSICNHFKSPKSWTFDSLLVPRFPTNHHQNPSTRASQSWRLTTIRWPQINPPETVDGPRTSCLFSLEKPSYSLSGCPSISPCYLPSRRPTGPWGPITGSDKLSPHTNAQRLCTQTRRVFIIFLSSIQSTSHQLVYTQSLGKSAALFGRRANTTTRTVHCPANVHSRLVVSALGRRNPFLALTGPTQPGPGLPAPSALTSEQTPLGVPRTAGVVVFFSCKPRCCRRGNTRPLCAADRKARESEKTIACLFRVKRELSERASARASDTRNIAAVVCVA